MEFGGSYIEHSTSSNNGYTFNYNLNLRTDVSMREDILELINRRERQLLVHSYLYYALDESIIADRNFDLWSKQMAEMMVEYPEEFSASEYYTGFIGFDGSSGFDLPFRSPEIVNRAKHLLSYHKELRAKGLVV